MDKYHYHRPGYIPPYRGRQQHFNGLRQTYVPGVNYADRTGQNSNRAVVPPQNNSFWDSYHRNTSSGAGYRGASGGYGAPTMGSYESEIQTKTEKDCRPYPSGRSRPFSSGASHSRTSNFKINTEEHIGPIGTKPKVFHRPNGALTVQVPGPIRLSVAPGMQPTRSQIRKAAKINRRKKNRERRWKKSAKQYAEEKSEETGRNEEELHAEFMQRRAYRFQQRGIRKAAERRLGLERMAQKLDRKLARAEYLKTLGVTFEGEANPSIKEIAQSELALGLTPESYKTGDKPAVKLEPDLNLLADQGIDDFDEEGGSSEFSSDDDDE